MEFANEEDCENIQRALPFWENAEVEETRRGGMMRLLAYLLNFSCLQERSM